MHLQTISFIERVQEPVCEEILLDEEPREQQFEEESCFLEEEPSFPNKVELSPQEANECELPLQLMEQTFEEEPSFPKEVELSSQEANECELPLQPTE